MTCQFMNYLCFYVIKTSLMLYLSSVYFVDGAWDDVVVKALRY